VTEKRLYISTSLTLFLASIWLYFFNNVLVNGLSICLFKNVFGIPCPACGGSRAIILIFEKQFQDAFFLNPLSFFMLVMLLMTFFLLLVDFLLKKRLMYKTFTQFELFVNKYRYILILFLFANWIWSIEKGL
jgi:hypothetical protein